MSDTVPGVDLFRVDLAQAIATSSAANRGYDLIITIEIRPGEEPAYASRMVRKRRRRKQAKPDERQAEMFT